MLDRLFMALSDVFDGSEAIEGHARAALRAANTASAPGQRSTPLPAEIREVMARSDALGICDLIAATPLEWSAPETSSDPAYIKVSRAKSHIELLGPDGLVFSDAVRLGLYGMLPNTEYGIRTHPAEEIYIMLAGDCDWLRGSGGYRPLGPGARSYHPSMMRHASRTGPSAFLSVYVWHGDVSRDAYLYEGAVQG